jgi:ribonucleoside-diphosphate reductase alpha chain
MARELGAFARYEENKEHMLRVIRNHRRAAYSAAELDYEGLSVTPQGIDAEEHCPSDLLQAAREAWDLAPSNAAREHGFRNAQVTVIAPTGTIGLVMDCDTTGIEPDFALVKFKKLAGGGYFKIINQSLVPALENLGYEQEEIEDIVAYAKGTARCSARRRSTTRRCAARASTDERHPKGRVPAQAELRPGLPVQRMERSARSSARERARPRQRGARRRRRATCSRRSASAQRRSRPRPTTAAAR